PERLRHPFPRRRGQRVPPSRGGPHADPRGHRREGEGAVAAGRHHAPRRGRNGAQGGPARRLRRLPDAPADARERVRRPGLLAVLLLLLAAAPRARADNELGIHAGKMSLNLGRAGSGTGSTSASGVSYGVDYIHAMGINVGLGLGLDYLKPADKSSDGLIANAHASTSIDSASFLGLLRVGSTEDSFQPNLILGLGVHYTSIRVDAAPAAGFGWKDTGTNEKRSLIDGAGWGAAIK